MKKLNVAVVGVTYFGQSFARIYAAHPHVDGIVLVDREPNLLKEAVESCKKINSNTRGYTDIRDVLADESIDAVHVCTGIPNHAQLSIEVLNAGKHCACAVPMATSLEDVQKIVQATRASGKNYMMMETMLYGTPFLYARDMLEKGEFGKIQYLRGVHHQPMDHGSWAEEARSYWRGLPPTHYATHAIAPLAAIANSRITEVACFGSGTMSEELVKVYQNPYPVEDALLRFENGLAGEVARSLFECCIKQSESYNIYGSRKSFMYEYKNEVWERFYDEKKYDRAGYITDVVHYPNRYDLLPEELWPYTIKGCENDPDWREKLDTAPWSMHEASHPHLCHEFITSILENRKSAIDEDFSANVTAAGICAHISAMNGGRVEKIPLF